MSCIGKYPFMPNAHGVAVGKPLFRQGGEQVMRLPTYRRLNLGLAVASLGLFGASVQPWLSGGAVAYAAGGYPWLVPPALRLWSAGAFAFTSLLCVSTWVKSVESRGILSRPARGAVGSLWALVPLPRQGGALDDPEKVPLWYCERTNLT